MFFQWSRVHPSHSIIKTPLFFNGFQRFACQNTFIADGLGRRHDRHIRKSIQPYHFGDVSPLPPPPSVTIGNRHNRQNICFSMVFQRFACQNTFIFKGFFQWSRVYPLESVIEKALFVNGFSTVWTSEYH